MRQLVKVLTCGADGTAQVLCIRESACSGDCHKCSGCGAAKETLIFTAQNPIGARPGELVTVESASGPVLKAAAVLYMLPLVLFIGAYLVGMRWHLGGLFGALAFVLSIGLVIGYDRLVMQKKNTVYTIVGYAKAKAQPQE